MIMFVIEQECVRGVPSPCPGLKMRSFERKARAESLASVSLVPSYPMRLFSPIYYGQRDQVDNSIRID